MRWPSWWCPGLPLLCFHDMLPLALSSKTLALRLVRLNIAGSVLLRTSHVELVRLHAEGIYLSFNDRIISRIKTHHLPSFTRLPSDIGKIHTNFLENCKVINFLFAFCDETKVLGAAGIDLYLYIRDYAFDFTSIPAHCRPEVEAWVISSNRTSLHARTPRLVSRGPYLIIGGRSSVSAHRTRRGRNGTRRSICWRGTVSGDPWSMSLSGIFSLSPRKTRCGSPFLDQGPDPSPWGWRSESKLVYERRFSGSQWIHHLRLD